MKCSFSFCSLFNAKKPGYSAKHLPNQFSPFFSFVTTILPRTSSPAVQLFCVRARLARICTYYEQQTKPKQENWKCQHKNAVILASGEGMQATLVDTSKRKSSHVRGEIKLRWYCASLLRPRSSHFSVHVALFMVRGSSIAGYAAKCIHSAA